MLRQYAISYLDFAAWRRALSPVWRITGASRSYSDGLVFVTLER